MVRIPVIGSGFQGSGPSALLAAGPSLLFAANDGQTGWELWMTDGTTAGTRLVVDYQGSGNPSELTAVIFDGPDKIQHLCWRFLDPEYAGSLEGDWAGARLHVDPSVMVAGPKVTAPYSQSMLLCSVR